MKKISSALKNNHEYIARPFALVGHEHTEYLDVNSNVPVNISTSLNFTGTITGIDPTTPGIIAGEAISALRILTANAGGYGIYADPTNEEHARKILGMSTSGGSINTPISLIREGRHEDDSWSFDPGIPLYLGANGTITQVAPASGVLVILGHAQTSKIIFLSLQPPIKLV